MCENHLDRKVYATPKEYDGFVNLHLHTSYSLLDGMSKPENVIKKVASIRQQSVGVTEHGNTFSSVKVHKLAKKENIKHIYGMEAYITEDRFVKDKTKRYYHLTLLAKNEQGRLNLNKLASLGFIEGFYFKPRIDHKLLEQYSEGIIVLSGCMGSELQQALAGGKIGDGDIEITEENKVNAKGIVSWYRKVFGRDYYLEVQAHRDYRQQKLNRAVIDLALEFGIEYVATTDSHFVEEDDHELHSIFIQIGQNREAGETYEDTFIMSSKEVYDRLESLTPEERETAIRTSLAISDKCNVDLPLSEPIIPHVPIPKGYDNETQYLKKLINDGWKKRRISTRFKDEIPIYKERLMYEFNAIEKMGFDGYFLLVNGYVNSVRRRGIARGSAGGSLICYLLGIVEINPIQHGLYFERFIDVGALDLLEQGTITRKELKIPDIDSDFSPKDREFVINNIIEEYGEEKFASLGQFGYLWDKSAIKDVGRVLGVPFAVTNKITQQLGDSTIEFALEMGQFHEYVEQYPKLFEYAQKIAGTPKSFGVHPCGKVVTIKDTDYYSSLASNDGVIVIQGDMEDADDLGLVKIDTLGLRSLDVIYDTLEIIDKDVDYIHPDNDTFDDSKVLELFKNGHTSGVFQFESVGMRETLRQVSPDGIEDLGVCNALFRPSSMKYIEHYAKRKRGEEQYEYLHPTLSEILKPTFGIMVFQEQLIEIGRLAGMRNADLLRQATGKKDVKKMNKAKPELFGGLKKLGWSEEQLITLWEIMIDFASYSFNKAHSSAYAIIAWQMAKLKTYHPVEFMTSLLNSVLNKRTEIATYINECKRMGIEILPPSINDSQGKFTIEDGKIRFGLMAIKAIGEPSVEIINQLRENKSFNSFEDFYTYMSSFTEVEDNEQSVLASDSIINLIKSGSFGSDKQAILKQYGELTYVPLKYKERKTLPQRADFRKIELEISEDDYQDKKKRSDIFNNFKYNKWIEKDAKRKQKHLDEFREKYVGDIEMYEFDTMACYLTRSPFDAYESVIKDFYSYDNGAEKILLVGTILDKTVKKASRGGQYAKLTVVTLHGVLQGKIYSNQYSDYKHLIEKNETVVALVKRSKDEFIVSKVKTFDEWKGIIERKNNAKKK